MFHNLRAHCCVSVNSSRVAPLLHETNGIAQHVDQASCPYAGVELRSFSLRSSIYFAKVKRMSLFFGKISKVRYSVKNKAMQLKLSQQRHLTSSSTAPNFLEPPFCSTVCRYFQSS